MQAETSPLITQNMDEKLNVVSENKQYLLSNVSYIDDIVTLSDDRVIGYRAYNYKSDDNAQKVVIFFPGAGFGRTHSPFYGKQEELLIKYNIGFIIIERPGYGLSTAQNDENRTYKSYADDINFICQKHFTFDKRIYFMAHSAGCPHLLSVAAFYPQLIKNCAIVCPPNPVYGNAPLDRPTETGCTRSIQRCCFVNCFCCLLCCFKPLVNSWQNDASAFMKFAKQNFGKLPVEKEFFERNPEFIDKQQNDFDYAVCQSKSGDGGKAMIQDMFIINSREWGFKIRDINMKKIFVWYGTEDDTAPNGKWYCNTLKNSVERRLDAFGHAAIFIKNEEILLDLISD